MSESIEPGMGPKVISHNVEYRVREVTRYILTEYYEIEYENGEVKKGSFSYGEFDRFHAADRTGRLCAMGSRHSGWEGSVVKFTDAMGSTILLNRDGTSTPVDE
jgi:hypothetical protein